MGLTVPAVIAISVGAIVIWLLKCIFDPLRNIPGPFFARFTKLWLVKQAWYGDFHTINLDLHKKYGK